VSILRILCFVLVINGLVFFADSSAEDLPLSIYGNLHLSLDGVQNDSGNSLALVSNASWFGIQGEQTLDEQFRMIWQFESTLDIASDWQYTSMADRNSFLGIETHWGTLLAGRHDTPFKLLAEEIDLFRYELGDLRQITFDWDHRLDHAIVFFSPESFPLDVALAVQALGNSGAKIFSGTLGYSTGGLSVGVGYESWGKELFYRPARDYYNIEPAEDGSSEAVVVWRHDYGNIDPQTATGFRVVSKFSDPRFEVSALYQALVNPDGRPGYNRGGIFKSVDQTSDIIKITYGLGGAFRFTEKWWFKGELYFADPNTSVDKDEGTLLAVGVDFRLDESFKIYTQAVLMNNSDYGRFSLGGGTDGHGYELDPATYGDANIGGISDSPNGISLGVIKLF
jgi:predicted porin